MENGALRDPYPRRPPFSNCLPAKLIRKKSQFEIKIRDPKKAAVYRQGQSRKAFSYVNMWACTLHSVFGQNFTHRSAVKCTKYLSLYSTLYMYNLFGHSRISYRFSKVWNLFTWDFYSKGTQWYTNSLNEVICNTFTLFSHKYSADMKPFASISMCHSTYIRLCIQCSCFPLIPCHFRL